MKSYIPNKKWVMTGALLAVLGVNVSFNQHKFGLASADYASSALEYKDEEIATASGMQNVRYVQIEENKVLVLKKDTEGNVCFNCADRSFKLDNANLSDIKNLNVKYLQEITKLPTPPAEKPTEEVKEEVAVDADEGDAEISSIALEKVLKSCERKEGSDKLSCLSDKYLAALKGKKGEKITEEQAEKFFDEEIAPLISEQIKEARNSSVKRLRASTGVGGATMYDIDRGSEFGGFADEMIENSYSDEDPKELLRAALDVVRELHGELPKRFTDIRKSLIKTERSIIDQHARDIAQTVRTASEQRNYYEKNALMQEADLLHKNFGPVARGLQTANSDGLADAYGSNLITSAYKNSAIAAFALSSNGLSNSMNKFMNEWYSTGNYPTGVSLGQVDSSGVPIGINLNDRLNGATRGGVLIPQTSTTISNRGAMNFSSQSAISTTMVDENGIPKAYWVIPQNNTGIEFGTVVPLTTTNAGIRDQLRIQQGL